MVQHETARADPFDGLRYVVIGGYTAELGGEAPGLVVAVPTGSRDDPVETRSVAEIVAPSWVLAHPDRPWLFTAGESTPSTIESFGLDEAGRLHPLSSVPSGGAGACHLALSEDEAFLLAANYDSGSVSSFAIAGDGTLTGPVDLLQLTGSGPDAERQDGPHAHQILPLDGQLLVCDLGTDRIHRLRLGGDGVFHRAADPIVLPPGSGPRHAVVVGDLLIVACELSAQLWVGRRADDDWTPIQLLSTTAATTEPRQPSGIATDGRTVVVATRGPDTISTFAIEQDGLRPLAEVGSGGVWPRAIDLRGDQLWVSNQNSGRVVVIDLADPAEPLRIVDFAAPSATCVVLLPVDIAETDRARDRVSGR
jgi:6-phosphogluconolactonase (cycloisomerase 2 family)